MRTLELRRHSLRDRPSPHLSQAGVTLARIIGSQIGSVTIVISSSEPRAYETAIAMGYAVNEFYQPVEFTGKEQRQLARLLPESMPLAIRAQVMRTQPLAMRYADALRSQWLAYANRLSIGQVGLIITHGGYIDDSAVACAPDADHLGWGERFCHLEGIRLHVDDNQFVRYELIRIDAEWLKCVQATPLPQFKEGAL